MWRLTGLVGIIILCTAIGYSFSMELLRRIRSLRELRRMMEILRGEIRYAKNPLNEAFLHISQESKGSFQKFFSQMTAAMEIRDGRTLSVLFQEFAPELKKGTGLRDEDVQNLIQTGGRLGYLDVEMQLRVIEYYLEELEKACAMAEEEYQGKGKIYRSLGFMGGLFFAVVLL